MANPIYSNCWKISPDWSISHLVKPFSLCVLLLNVNTFTYSENLTIEETLVTGTYLESNTVNNASPIEIISADYIENSGAADVAELTAKWSSISGTENNADAFTAGETQGTSNLNLRGLGLSSTLVLINGKRQVNSSAIANDGSVFVDTSTIPIIAINRVEILKEGATAAYGSDAVAGVVNFILRDEFEGLEVTGTYDEIEKGSSGKANINFIAGKDLGKTKLLFSGTYINQDSMNSNLRPYTTENAISSLGRSFLILDDGAIGNGSYAGHYSRLETVPDPNCAANGGIESTPFVAVNPILGTGGGSKCGFLYGPRFNLLNKESKYQWYANLTHKWSDTLSLSAELGWTAHKVKDNPQSPSYPNLSFPTLSPGQAGSPFNVPVRWYGRPVGSESPSPLAPRENQTLRASITISGKIKDDWNWATSLTHSANDRDIYQPDTIKSRLNRALMGAGGQSGSDLFNPFDPSQNSPDLIRWFSYQTHANKKTELTVLDLVLTKEVINIRSKNIGFATGLQWRKEGFSVWRNELYTQGFNSASGQVTPIDLIFLGGGLPVDQSRDSFAFFAETNIQLSDRLESNVAVRFEDLETESSIDPKVAIKWNISSTLSARASVSTTFREPSLIQIYNQETSLQGLVDPVSGSGSALFVQVNSKGNAELTPETSENINSGVVFSPNETFSVRADYWRLRYKDVVTVQNAQGKLNANPTGPSVIRDTAGTLAGVNVEYLNAQKVTADGIDIAIDWSTSLFYGDLDIGVSTTRFLNYEIPCIGLNTRGCSDTTGVQDVVGFFNFDNFARSIPEIKTNITADWRRGRNKLSLLIFYVSDYQTTRPIPEGPSKKGYTAKIESWTTVDAQYSRAFDFHNFGATFSFGIKNIFNEEAPRVYDAANLSYDAKHHDPRGRVYYTRFRISL